MEEPILRPHSRSHMDMRLWWKETGPPPPTHLWTHTVGGGLEPWPQSLNTGGFWIREGKPLAQGHRASWNLNLAGLA